MESRIFKICAATLSYTQATDICMLHVLFIKKGSMQSENVQFDILVTNMLILVHPAWYGE